VGNEGTQAGVVERLTTNAAAQEASTKQSRVQTTEIKRLRSVLRDGHLKPIVRMSRTMTLEINGADITFTLPDFDIDNERLAAASDVMVTALNEVGPQFIARGFGTDFVEQVSTARQRCARPSMTAPRRWHVERGRPRRF